MQDYVKKYFWLLGVVTVLVSSVIAAQAANHVIEGTFLSDSAEPAEVSRPPSPRRSEKKFRSKVGNPLAKRNMFCSDCEPEQPGQPSETPSTDPDSVPKTSLPLELLATNLAPKAEHSFATIRNTTSSSQGAYWLEQEIPGAGPVVRITGKYVDFRNSSSNRIERIALLNERKASRPSRPTPPRTPRRPSTARPKDELTAMLDEGIKKTGDDRYEIDRALVDKLLENPMSVARGARIVPSVRDGKANGFKLYAIRPSSVYGKIGLRNGDTVSAVNGFDLSSPDKALQVYTKVREANNLTVSIIRRGKPMTLNYSIR